ncbi:MAG: hypothetical protein ACFFA8_05360 [Promethearchaeota archaeon]
MAIFSYLSSMVSAVEFLIALGSVIGLLGLLVGLIFLIWGSPRMRGKMVGVIIISIILLALCGVNTGMKYFRVYR